MTPSVPPNLRIGNHPAGNEMAWYITTKDYQKVLADPDTITLLLQDPADEVTAIELASMEKVSTGVYIARALLDSAGTWYWYLSTTGDPTLAAQGHITVVEPYVTAPVPGP